MPDDSEKRMTDLNEDTGLDASAEEFKERIEETYGDIEHGSAAGKPDPTTAESSPEDAGTQKGGMQEVDTQDTVASARDERQYGAP